VSTPRHELPAAAGVAEGDHSDDDRFGPTVTAFDAWVDEQLERLRGVRAADVVFESASHLGDWSLIWHLTAAVRGVTSERRSRQAFELAALLAVESLLVNQGIKRIFRRNRPTETGDERYNVRRPSTSSFPSGHASAAFFAAGVLSSLGGRRSAIGWYSLAIVVAVSRVYVRIHHASDIVGGAVVGVVLGKLVVAMRRALTL
jgi:membrane-associated phospholipid phosphatase